MGDIVHNRVMHRYVAKRVQPSPIILKRIVEKTDVNPVCMLTGEGPMFKSELSSFRSPEQIRQEMLHSSEFYDLPEGLRKYNTLQNLDRGLRCMLACHNLEDRNRNQAGEADGDIYI